jgi:hypothetical protein
MFCESEADAPGSVNGKGMSGMKDLIFKLNAFITTDVKPARF